MEWRFEGGAPIYAQIVDAVKLAIVSGELPPGARLQGVRELALEAGVNPNTMQRALSELERQGLLYTLRTAGRYVTGDEAVIRAARRELAGGYAAAFLTAMERLGMEKSDMIKLLEADTRRYEHGNFGV